MNELSAGALQLHVVLMCILVNYLEAESLVEMPCRIGFEHAEPERGPSGGGFVYQLLEQPAADALALEFGTQLNLDDLPLVQRPLDFEQTHRIALAAQDLRTIKVVHQPFAMLRFGTACAACDEMLIHGFPAKRKQERYVGFGCGAPFKS